MSEEWSVKNFKSNMDNYIYYTMEDVAHGRSLGTDKEDEEFENSEEGVENIEGVEK